MAEVYCNQVAILRELDYVKVFHHGFFMTSAPNDARMPGSQNAWQPECLAARMLGSQNAWQKAWNHKGLIAQDEKTRKAAFTVMQAFYGELTGAGAS